MQATEYQCNCWQTKRFSEHSRFKITNTLSVALLGKISRTKDVAPPVVPVIWTNNHREIAPRKCN